MNAPMALKGAPGSPYTRKMLALLRYRRIPYRLLHGMAAEQAGLPKPAVELLPTFYLPDASGALQAVTDSTPLLRRFEREISTRAVLPRDPVLRFIDSVLEDYADEWLSKAMYHYRWQFAPDIDKAGSVIPLQYLGTCIPAAMARGAKQQFSARQIGRLAVVGSSALTAGVIEASYERLLDRLDAHFERYPFLMGARPGACDFALYGQLTQMTQIDPTPMAIALARSPRTVAWVGLVEDLSGLEPGEGDWIKSDALPETLIAVLQEVARCYVPMMLANACAHAQAAREFQTLIDGLTWSQATVSYQAKCVRWLREEFAALRPSEQALADDILQRGACAALVHEALASACAN